MHEKVRAVIAETQKNFVALDEAIELLVLAALAEQHSYLVGPPGVAKSAVARAVAEMLGGSFFGIQCTAQTVVEDLLGPLDVAAYRGKLTWYEHFQACLTLSSATIDEDEKTGYHVELTRALEEGSRKIHVTQGYLPSAEIAFIDEPDKASSVTYQALLLALNERQFNQGGQLRQLPLRAAIMAGNAMPDPIMASAFTDRIAVRLFIPGDLSDDDFQKVAFSEVSAKAAPGGLTSDEWKEAAAQVAQVGTSHVRRTVVILRRSLLSGGIEVTARRWKAMIAIAKAKAWLNGRTELQDLDLQVAKHVLWDIPDMIPTLSALVDQYCSGPLTEAMRMVNEVIAAYDAAQFPTPEFERAHTELKTAAKELDRLYQTNPEYARDIEALRDSLTVRHAEGVRKIMDRIGNIADRPAAVKGSPQPGSVQ